MRIAEWILVPLLFATSSAAEPLSLGQFRHVTFDKIPETKYVEDQGGLKAEVVSSSSFLLKAFPAVRTIKKLSWKWKMVGDYRVDSFEKLSSKKGDDAVIRIGLIKEGSAPTVPFFAPAWIKAIRDHMKLPGDELTYFLAGGPAKPGTKWVSPYSDSMNLVQVESAPLAEGWNQASHDISPPIKAVGLWIMSDGDNTESKFTTWIRDLEFTE